MLNCVSGITKDENQKEITRVLVPTLRDGNNVTYLNDSCARILVGERSVVVFKIGGDGDWIIGSVVAATADTFRVLYFIGVHPTVDVPTSLGLGGPQG